jgi:hypothetical protein
MLHELDSIVAVAESEAQLKRVFKSMGKPEFARFQALLDEYLKVEVHTFPDAVLALKAAQPKEFGLRVRELISGFDIHGPGLGGAVMSARHVEHLREQQKAIRECRDAMRTRLVERTYMIINPELKPSAVKDGD